MKLHVVDAALANLPVTMTPAEKARVTEETDSNMTQFSYSLARSIMKCMVANAGQFPVLYCTVPGTTVIDNFNQIGISKVTFVGGEA
jgi:hypothetical protein